MIRSIAGTVLLSLTMASGAGAVLAQDYPSKTIRIITQNPGGGSDLAARRIAQEITGQLGQPVIVDNRAGVIPFESAAKAPPDGYTVLLAGNTFWTIPLLQKAAYDAVNDFAPITLISKEVFVFAVHPSLPVKSVRELIALAKSRPGELNYAGASRGSPQHLAGELFKSMTGINFVTVSYKGSGQMMPALIGGQVQMTMTDLSLVAPHARAGRLRALAVTSAEPSMLMPELPTVAATVPGFEAIGRTGLWAPAKTPTAIITRLNHEVVRALNLPSVKEKFLSTGAEVVGNTPEQFGATIKSEVAKISKTIRDANIKLD